MKRWSTCSLSRGRQRNQFAHHGDHYLYRLSTLLRVCFFHFITEPRTKGIPPQCIRGAFSLHFCPVHLVADQVRAISTFSVRSENATDTFSVLWNPPRAEKWGNCSELVMTDYYWRAAIVDIVSCLDARLKRLKMSFSYPFTFFFCLRIIRRDNGASLGHYSERTMTDFRKFGQLGNFVCVRKSAVSPTNDIRNLSIPIGNRSIFQTCSPETQLRRMCMSEIVNVYKYTWFEWKSFLVSTWMVRVGT